ncbi:hypothetical protein CWI84_11545 [Idiomarina tyrosinivorans]|uniref:DUF2059 domain-containing protein n=2 Tax=Idiomarina tyrosinivorans TaxID=1445662 RepID=A0A432ZF18_9GAMM|nr:hypothetical protein CWI84_11545 [Idiomarina tyrosinivorans]
MAMFFTITAMTSVYSVHAIATSATIISPPQQYNQKLAHTYSNMLEGHLAQNFSIYRSVRILLSNYPEHVNEIVAAAIKKQPQATPGIVNAAMRTEPALTEDTLNVALALQPQQFKRIIKTALATEPAYADQIVLTASRFRPQSTSEILRVALKTEPSMSDAIVRSAASSQPEKLWDFVISAVKQVPSAAEQIFTGITAWFTGDNMDPTIKAEQLKKPQWREVIVSAINAGVKKEDVSELARKVKLSDEELAELYRQQQRKKQPNQS